MFKSGVKRILLTLGIVFCSAFIFTACGKGKVKVTGIDFQDKEMIKMVVGQTYEPKVVVTPSYADNTDYYFEVVSGSNFLEVVGKTIVAKNAGTAQLKVFAEDDDRHNKTISVKIIPEAIMLDPPEDLTFDGQTFSFSSVEDALGYKILINGTEINLGNTTFYTLNQFEKLTAQSQTGKVLNANVKSIGDGTVSLSSDYDEENLIKVLKIPQVENPKFENNLLKFQNIENVKKYSLQILKQGQEILNLQLDAEDYDTQISFEIAPYISSFVGGEYVCKITALKDEYESEDGVVAYQSETVVFNFNVLVKPNNLKMSNYVLHWDRVANATSYAIYDLDNNLVVDNILTTSYDVSSLELKDLNSFKIVAKTEKTENVIAGINFSQTITFEKLSAPTILSCENKMIKWGNVANAKGYRFVVFDKDGKVVVDKNMADISSDFVNFDVSSFEQGEYSFEIYSLGNGVTVLSSLESSKSNFEVLEKVSNLKIENKLISWESKNTNFKIEIFKKLDNELFISENLSDKSFSLEGRLLESGEYGVKVFAVGSGNVFNSKNEQISFYKLSSLTNLAINNKVVTFNVDQKTISTEATYSKVGTNSSNNLNRVDLTTFEIDDKVLSAGEYSLNVKVLGNGKDILDADASEAKPFYKLETPSFAIDRENQKLVRTSDVNYAERYLAYRNDEEFRVVQKDVTEIPLTKNGETIFVADEYTYTFKSIGNNKEVLDSDITTQTIRVLKLNNPELEFDKEENKISSTTNQYRYISEYYLTLDGVEQTSLQQEDLYFVNCEDKFLDPKDYAVEAKFLPIDDLSQTSYDLIIQSDVSSTTITKINADTEIRLEKGNIYIEPLSIDRTLLNNGEIIFTLKITDINSGDELVYTDARWSRTDNSFVIDVIDENYNIIGPKLDGNFMFENATSFEFVANYNSEDALVIGNSNSTLSNVTKLEKTQNILKGSQTNGSEEYILFNKVGSNNGYMLEIEDNGEFYYAGIDLGDTGVEYTNIVISIDDLINAYAQIGLNFEQNVEYLLRVITLGKDENYTISSKSDEVFSLVFLSSPNITIDEINSEKQLKIENINNAKSYEITYNYILNGEEKVRVDIVDKQQSTNTYVALPDFAEGVINVGVRALSNLNVFKSHSSTLSYNQILTPNVSVENGKVVWNKINNASSYLLTYNDNGVPKTLNLLSDNYIEQQDKIVYDFTNLNSGTTSLKIKAISILSDKANKYNNSSYSNEITVVKLSQPTSSVVDGELQLNIKDSELQYIDRIEIVKDGTSYNILEIAKVEELANSLTILPENLLDYKTESSIASESFILSIFAKDDMAQTDTFYLNANDLTIECKGLKTVSNIELATSSNIGDGVADVIDKIQWVNNSLNDGKVNGYQIVITHNGEEYFDEKVSVSELLTTNSYIFPKTEQFGDGEYKIKIKTLGADEYLNSQFSEEFSVWVCGEVNDASTTIGCLEWGKVENAEKYIVRVYNSLGVEDRNNLVGTRITSETTLDFALFTELVGESEQEYSEGLYYVTIQAINESNPTVVSSGEGKALEIVKLPKVTNYKIERGQLVVLHHKYVSALKITLRLAGETYHEIITTELSDKIYSSVEGCDNWSDYAGLEADLTAGNMVQTIIGERYKNLFSIIELEKIGNFSLEIMAIGNSTTPKSNSPASFATVNSASTKSENLELVNDNAVTTNYVNKLVTPKVELTARGMFEWCYSDDSELEYPDGINYEGLTDHLIYDVVMQVANKDYNFYVIDKIDLDNLPTGATLTELTSNGEVYCRYIKYNDMYINILRYIKDGEVQGKLKIDFNTQTFYYIGKNGGDAVGLDFVSSGSFAIKVSIVGDDTYYLSSNFSEIIELKRYAQPVLSVVDGHLQFLNQSINGFDVVYLVKVNDTYSVYLYNENDGNYILPDENNAYKHALDFTGEKINYMFDTTDESGNYLFNNAIYNVTVQIISSKNDFSILDSKESSRYSVTKLANTCLGVENGILFFKQTVVNGTKINNYEINAVNGDKTVTFRISENNYTIYVKNGENYIYYELEETIVDINDNEFTFEDLEGWTFNVKALGYTSYINSNEAILEQVKMTSVVDSVYVVDNRIVWIDENASAGQKYSVRLILKDEDNNTICKIEQKNIYGTSYELTQSSLKDVNGKSQYLSSSYKYYVAVRKTGDSSTLSSFYKEIEFPIEKLKKVDVNTLTYAEGKVGWMAITNLAEETIEGVEYEIEFVSIEIDNRENKASKITISDTEYAFEDMAGEIKFKINVKHSNYFESKFTDEIVIYKLYKVGEITPNVVGDIVYTIKDITWDAVSVNGVFAEKYVVEIENVESGEVNYFDIEDVEGLTTISLDVSTMDIAGMNIRIVAISSTNHYLSSDWSSVTTFKKAEGISEEGFTIDEEKYQIKFLMPQSAQESDKYLLNFIWAEPYVADVNNANSSNSEVYNIIVERKDFVEVSKDDATAYEYSYQLKRIGKYFNINVTVIRGDEIFSSTPVYMLNEHGNFNPYTFNIFEAGQGTEEDPYEIINATQFRNINLFLNDHYIINEKIDLGQNSESIIKGEFTGTINGGLVNEIKFDINSTVNYIGLFERMNGATISNIVINGSVVNVSHSAVQSKLYSAILVAYANNSTFENIKIVNSNFNVLTNRESGTDSAYYYYGGIAGYLANSTIKYVDISLGSSSSYNEINLTGHNKDIIYYGGVAGYIYNSAIGAEETQSKVTVYYQSKIYISLGDISPVLYFGGVTGVIGDEDYNDVIVPNNTINNILVKVDQGDSVGFIRYNGGVVGYASHGTINSVIITGNIGEKYSNNTNYQNYLGKIVAKIQSNVVKLSNNSDEFEENKATINSTGTGVVVNDVINNTGNG